VQKRRWRIGELARAAGLTVRALHYYEAIGLISPTERTEARHRLYGPECVSRLYRVLALRGLGLSLTEIGRCLGSEQGELEVVVGRQLADLEQRIDEQTRLRSRLQFILGALHRNEEPSIEGLLEAMEAMTMFERYFSQDQLAQLRDRHERLGDDAVKQGEQQWAELLAEVETARRNGVDPTSPDLSELWVRMQGLIEQFTGGDPAIRQSLQNMYQTEDITQASRGAVSPELWAYMQKARSGGG
jgi:DNA-binding transcriptional MerR regulator